MEECYESVFQAGAMEDMMLVTILGGLAASANLEEENWREMEYLAKGPMAEYWTLRFPRTMSTIKQVNNHARPQCSIPHTIPLSSHCWLRRPHFFESRLAVRAGIWASQNREAHGQDAAQGARPGAPGLPGTCA